MKANVNPTLMCITKWHLKIYSSSCKKQDLILLCVCKNKTRKKDKKMLLAI